MSKTKQADSEIHEDQLLNFLVNTLDEEVALDLGANAEFLDREGGELTTRHLGSY